MPTTVNGYYDGEQIVINQRERHYLNRGDQLVINIIHRAANPINETLAERRIRMVENEEFVTPTGRSTEEIDRIIRELRENDRI